MKITALLQDIVWPPGQKCQNKHQDKQVNKMYPCYMDTLIFLTMRRKGNFHKGCQNAIFSTVKFCQTESSVSRHSSIFQHVCLVWGNVRMFSTSYFAWLWKCRFVNLCELLYFQRWPYSKYLVDNYLPPQGPK